MTPDPATAIGVPLVFGATYVAMFFGGVPGLAIDRTGAALLGAIAMIGLGAIEPARAWASVDPPAMAVLFGLMIVSAQLKLSGFYSLAAGRLAASGSTPPRLLGAVVFVSGGLSALLTNDVVCLAMAPPLIEGCRRRGLNPLPFLLGLACGSNAGSAATLIGNPQNILIGEALRLSFAGYLWDGGAPAAAGLAATWCVLAFLFRGRWFAAGAKVLPPRESPPEPFRPWPAIKGGLALGFIVAAFLFAPWPRGLTALAAGGILLLSRRTATRELLGEVDWQLLTLFAGLFIVNAAFGEAGWPARAAEALRSAGADPARPAALFGLSFVLSNLVSNVPAVMLLLPSATHPLAGPVLALSSTLAGNALIVSSIANIIVADAAIRSGVSFGWREHARAGIPVTLATLAAAGGWLWLRS